MKTSRILKQVVFGAAFFISLEALARPEYAAEANIVNCGVCHVNPYGSGARTVQGKLFGSRDYKAAWFSKQEIVSLDMRGQEYLVERTPPTNSQSKGLMIMNAIPTVNLPISPDLHEPANGQVVMAYNFAPVGASMREAYYMMNFSQSNSFAWVSHLLFGDFQAPFGLLTDEHRTYTHQMVAMTTREFESGALLTGDPNYKFHYDVAITSGFANGGVGVDGLHPDSWAVFGNIRHQILNMPLQVGLSYSVEGQAGSNNQTASAVYGVFSFDRYTGPSFRGNIQTEFVYASGWNNSSNTTAAGDGIGYFIPTSAGGWQTALNNSNSGGMTTLFNWDLNRHWTVQAKYEQFIPDISYQGDSFYRSGGGFKYYFNSNANLLLRYDHGYVTRPGLTTVDLSGIKAVGDTYLAMLHIWL